MTNEPLRVYADTSVFGGVFDEEFRQASAMFFDQVRQGRFRLVLSPLVEDELENAPEHVRSLWQSLVPFAESVDVTPMARALQGAYLASGVVGKSSADDALHVAVATTAGCALIVSWNFRHIVHFDKIRLYNEVNVKQGRSEIAIYSPREVIAYEDENKDI